LSVISKDTSNSGEHVLVVGLQYVWIYVFTAAYMPYVVDYSTIDRR